MLKCNRLPNRTGSISGYSVTTFTSSPRGKTWTEVEYEAGVDAAHHLTPGDPEPPTIFRMAAGPDQRLIEITLRYVTPRPPTRNGFR